MSLIEQMSRENPLWSRRRIASELAKLGHAATRPSPVADVKDLSPQPSRGKIAIGFLTVPTVTFNVLCAFFVLSLDRRRMLHVNVTVHPYAAWTAQQIVNAIGAESVPRDFRDRTGAIFGAAFDARVDNLGVRQVRTSRRSPWQNGYAERWIGTLRRELLDHVIVLGERHLLRLLRPYVA